MALITFQNVHYGVGGPALLEDVVLAIEAGERVCVVGRNGAGKSTLLRLLAREIVPDDGEIRFSEGVRVGRLAQEVPGDTDGSVFDVVADGLGELGHWLADFHRISHAAVVDTDALAQVQARIERANGWDLERRVAQVVTQLDLPEDAAFASLSGGLKRRVLLARALVAQPDVLLLDEPTNHLDIASIDWLEEFLRGFRGSLVFVTHDRRFLRALATRIVEIDRGRVSSWPGDYDNYLRRREERAHAQAQENARFDKLLAAEEVWIRQGIKARRTRDEGRVRRLEAMRRERGQRREQVGTVKLASLEAQASGRKVIQAGGVSFAYEGRAIVRDLTTTILRGDRIGLIGPNGVGKTTLIRLLLGQIAPQSGEVKLGTNLQVAYFDQHRAALREDWNALDNVSEGLEFIETNGGRKHVLAYLQDFLFTPERARAPITRLSGGERNRLLLAKLFAQPSNLLVMDEPTNDLDVETLELLEELLADYPGTLLLVSHDREFLDRVVTGTLAFEGDGRIGDYVGGYSDWLRQRPAPAIVAPTAVTSTVATPAATTTTTKPAAPVPARRKLGFKEQRELDQLPARIETLEADIATRTAAMQEPQFYRKAAADILAANAALAAAQAELEHAYARWMTLEGG
ncbi:MAG: ATP-binding cassette domain-containing protein [Proteobacteria bacterium]|nr:ATP-binding cassette domain-containing protein [Pseudomonadota bacterium]